MKILKTQHNSTSKKIGWYKKAQQKQSEQLGRYLNPNQKLTIANIKAKSHPNNNYSVKENIGGHDVNFLSLDEKNIIASYFVNYDGEFLVNSKTYET